MSCPTRYSASFNPAIWLEKFSLIENLQAESDRIKASKELSVTLQHPGTIDMPPDRQIMLFRMVQEALQNSIKHGQASQISILAELLQNTLRVVVTDNGRGFNTSDTSIHGVGLTNIKHRAQLMGGSALWNSNQEGTSVTIQLPVYGS